MRYKSTRDESILYTFEEALCSGYAPDGGLFVPESLPKIGREELRVWSELPFSALAGRILRMFVSADEVSDGDLESICDASYVDGFDHPETVCVRRLGSAFVAELFHGPTFCFKDLGMRPVVNLLSHFSTRRNRQTTLLVSTTGDTGPAAVQAVGDAANPLLTILVHYPLGQISALQRRQLTTVRSPQVHVAAFEGGGDDMDAPIKRILTSQSESPGEGARRICGVNSYNIGRPLMQMVHFIWVYLRVAEQMGLDLGDPSVKVDVVLPTGAMGNIAAGYLAKKMGVPLGMLCAGVNINDITHRAIEHGEFHKSEKMERTLSEAINIQVPYNFERLLFYLTEENHNLIKEWMTTMDNSKKLDLDQVWLRRLQGEFRSARVTDEEMCKALKSVRDSYNYVTDPHTAVAVAAAEKIGYDISKKQENPVAILSTASPCKFQESVTAALGEGGWEQYHNTEYPERARKIMEIDEVPPTIYKWQEGETLSIVQSKWEKMARDIMAEQLG